jgi:hemoglobin-like flavoprotein
MGGCFSDQKMKSKANSIDLSEPLSPRSSQIPPRSEVLPALTTVTYRKFSLLRLSQVSILRFSSSDTESRWNLSGRSNGSDHSRKGTNERLLPITPRVSVTEVDMTNIQLSWIKVKSIGEQEVAILLMKNVFSVAPDWKALFGFTDSTSESLPENVIFHGKMVLSIVGTTIGGNSGINDYLVPLLKDLGRKHSKLSLTQSQYTLIGEQLIKTIQESLEDEFTTEVRDSWLKVFNLVSDIMQDHSSSIVPD